MKTLSRILVLSALIVFTFSSCGDDDDNEKKSRHSINAKCEFSLKLFGFENQETTTQLFSKSLDEMLSGQAYESPIIGGSMKVTGSAFRITGLESGTVLKKFTLSINNIEKDFGDITSENIDLYLDKHIDYFKSTFNSMVSPNFRGLKVKAKFTPSKTLLEEDQIKVELVYDGTYDYLK